MSSEPYDKNFPFKDNPAVTETNEFRTNIIHGTLHQRKFIGTDWSVFIAKEGKSRLEKRIVTYSNDEITRYCEDMVKLSEWLSPFIAKIIGLPHPDNR